MSTEEMRKLNADEPKEEMQNGKYREIYTEEEKKVYQRRDKLDSLYYLRSMMQSLEGVNIIIENRMKFYEEYHLDLQEYVLWGRYLLTYRGTIQKIDQEYLLGKKVDITTLADFMKSVSSLRTEPLVAFPPRGCFCAECHGLITFEDVKEGNFDFKINKFVHKTHKKQN